MSVDKYVFDAPFGETLKSTIGQWIKAELTKLQGDEPEDLFLEYILMMIEHKKTMGEIGKELAELIGEEVSVKFAADLGAELQTKMTGDGAKQAESKAKGKSSKAKAAAPAEEQAISKSAAALINSVAANSKAAMLKNVVRSGREEKVNKSEQEVKKSASISSRIGEALPNGNKSALDRPLQSSRGGDGRDNNYSDNRDSKRKRDDSSYNERGSNKQGRPSSSSSSSSSVPMMPMMPVLKPGEALDPEAYRGQMEVIAKMQGFGSADDMIAAQKSMLMMAQAMGIGAARGGGRGSSIFRGRGAYSYRGRGGRGFDTVAASGAGEETFTGTEEVYHFKSSLGGEAAAVPFSSYRGRGASTYRGRGSTSFRGRGAPTGRGAVAAPAQTKWVRQPDVEDSLSALR